MSSTCDPAADAVSAVLEEIGVPASVVRSDATLLDLMLDEDLTFWFVPGVQKRLGISPPTSAWEQVRTVSDAIEMLRSHLPEHLH